MSDAKDEGMETRNKILVSSRRECKNRTKIKISENDMEEASVFRYLDSKLTRI